MPCDSNCLSNLCVATWFYQYRIQLVPLKSETSNILHYAPLAPVTCTGQATTGASSNAGLPCRHTSSFLGDITIFQTLLLRSCVSITFPVAVIRCHHKGNARKMGLILVHSSKGPSRTRKAWQQKLEGTGHALSAGSKRREV